MINLDSPLNIFITSPLEQEYVEIIRSVSPDKVNVIYDPDILPPPRFLADHKGEENFRRTPEQEQRWLANLSIADILWDFPATSADGPSGEIPSAPNVKWVQTTSSGVGQTVKNLGLQKSDIQITTARGIHARPLTEFVFHALLSHFKQRSYLEQEQRAHRWERYCGTMVAGKTLAVIGAGGVGKQVMSVGRAFGMRIVALASPGSTRTAEDLGADQLYLSTELHTMLAETDVLVLSMPHTPDTEGLINTKAISVMKRGVVFINIARGLVVDEDALIEALRSGHIGFAALDVFATEPLPANNPLWDLPNVLVSPHSASTVDEENQMITDIFCTNLQCFIEGRLDEMTNIFNKERMY